MSAMKEFLSNSYLFGANAPFIEEVYEAYLDNPQSVTEQWREYFDKLQAVPAAGSGGRDVAHAPIVESFARRPPAAAARPAPAVPGPHPHPISPPPFYPPLPPPSPPP